MKNEFKKAVNGIDSINNELYDDMSVNELEKRLETDPLLANGLLNLVSHNSMNPVDMDLLCDGCHADQQYVICKGGTY